MSNTSKHEHKVYVLINHLDLGYETSDFLGVYPSLHKAKLEAGAYSGLSLSWLPRKGPGLRGDQYVAKAGIYDDYVIEIKTVIFEEENDQ